MIIGGYDFHSRERTNASHVAPVTRRAFIGHLNNLGITSSLCYHVLAMISIKLKLILFSCLQERETDGQSAVNGVTSCHVQTSYQWKWMV